MIDNIDSQNYLVEVVLEGWGDGVGRVGRRDDVVGRVFDESRLVWFLEFFWEW